MNKQEELYMVYDKEDGLICVANKEMAEKEYKKAVDSAQRYLSGMYLDEDDMGYQTILAQVKRGYLLQRSEEINEWEESFVEPVRINKNQQIVLEWLKSVGRDMPIYRMADQMKWYMEYATTGEELDHALASLNGEEEFQVLAAFAEWGMKNE